MVEKVAIKEKLTELVNAPYSKDLEKEFNEVINTFNTIFEKEKAEEISIDEDDAEAIAKFEENKKINAEILALIQQFKNNKEDYLAAIKAEEEKNVELKKEIIADFKQLVEEEENLGALFGKVKEIREKWNAIGNIPQKYYQKLQAEYSKLNEDFSYNINIYKALQDNDLKKNYSLKNQVIHKVKELQENKNIKELEKQVRVLQRKWDEIGPTYKEHWEALKEEYWTNIQKIYDRIKAHYESQKEQQAENLEKKQALIVRLKEVTSPEFETHQDWDKATKEVIALQAEWKTIGFVPKEKNEEIWTEFRGVSNEFFDKKAAFYKEKNDIYSKNAALKKQLIEKVDAIKDSKEWKKTAEAIRKIQAEWKKIGHAGKAYEQKLWKEFRAKSDAFFDARAKYFEELDKANEGNLAKKEALIKEIENFKPLDDAKETVAKLKEYSKQFLEIGNVPFKDKDRIYQAYKKALDKVYDSLNMDKLEKEKAMFEAKISSLMASANPSKTIQIEKEKIRKKINELTKEIANYENNLGFFNLSKGSESLLSGVQSKIDNGRKNIEKLKAQLKMFSKVEKESKESKEDNEENPKEENNTKN